VKRLWKGEIFTVCCFGKRLMFIRRQKGKVTYFLLLIQSNLLRLPFRQYYGTNLLLLIELCLISCTKSMLLTFFKQVRCGVKQCCITHSLSTWDWFDKSAYNDRITHLLLVIWCTWDHLPKIKVESCHSLPVDYGTRLLITRASVTHKLLSWDNISELC